MENDFEERKKEFLAEYGKLVEKYDCDFFAFPMFMPEESKSHLPAFKVCLQQQIVDRKTLPQPSPFIP